MASDAALVGGIGMHVGGGFHHAFPDHGEGFCVFNDVAIAARKLKNEGRIERALIIDCDLHQGNGTAYIFSEESDIFTFSIHQENNYPFYKPKSDLDIGLRNMVRDQEYIGQLRQHIPRIVSDHKPDIIYYIAGADPYKGDMIGNLSLSMDGLKRRDSFVFNTARHFDVPIVSVLAGGYAKSYEDTVTIHYNTVAAGLASLASRKSIRAK
jgi:acetoin utilization deacetylase AcuC-like enzyme